MQYPFVSKIWALCISVIVLSFALGCVILAWTNPTTQAPNNNVEAPINVSSNDQSKTGSVSFGTGLNYWISKDGDSFVLKNNAGTEKLILGQDGNTTFNGQIIISGGNPGNGKILTSDANGLATWQTSAASGLGGSGTASYIPKFVTGTTLGNSIVFDDGTNVGIGTNNPNAKLDVNGNLFVNGQIKVTGGAPGTGKVLTSDASGLATWQNVSGATLPAGASGQTLRHDGTNWVANSVIFNDGTNVGIGTATPGAKLDISGQVKITGGSPGVDKILVSDASGLATWQTLGTGTLLPGIAGQTLRHNGTKWIANSVIFNDGTNVGIGTASPGAALEVAGQVKITGGTPGAGKVLTSDAAGLATWQTPAAAGLGGSGTANYLPKFTAATTLGNSLVYDNGTNVGIGTAGPAYKLQIDRGDLMVRGTNNYGSSGNTARLYLGDANAYISAKNGTGLQFGTFTAADMVTFLQGSGNVGIGTASPGAKLEVAGQVKITGGTPGTGKVLTSDAAGLATWETPVGGKSDGSTAIRKGWGSVTCPAGTTCTQLFDVSYGITFDSSPSFIANFAGASPEVMYPVKPTSLADCTIAFDLQKAAEPLVSNVRNDKAALRVMSYGSDHNMNPGFYTCYTWVVAGPYSGADLAEYYKTDDRSIEPGDVVAIDKNKNIQIIKSQKAHDEEVVGVISTKPGQVLGDSDTTNSVLVALAGRVPVKVSLENGIIRKGDYLTASSVPGVAMKATQPGVTIGKAMSDFDGTATTELIPAGTAINFENSKLTPEEIADLNQGLGKVMVFLNVDYWEPASYETNQDAKINWLENKVLELESKQIR